MNIVRLLVIIGSIGCTSCQYTFETYPKGDLTQTFTSSSKKALFVFYDGTRNGAKSNTNIYRLFKLIEQDQKPNTHAIWIEGVGSSSYYLTGTTLGRGIEVRVSKGYRFLSEHYNPGDDIYIFGFSRGAHQARALAGLVSYAGLIDQAIEDERKLNSVAHTIIEMVKDRSDDEFINYWLSWTPGTAPPVSNSIEEKLSIKTTSAKIRFLGLWDTVPGSSFKAYQRGDSGIQFTDKDTQYRGCKESKNNKLGDRYKLDSYPTIQQISHAISIEEKRSKFRVVLACKPLNHNYTSVNQVWFPGAHADVGGGYTDDDSLSALSFDWMINELTAPQTDVDGLRYTFNTDISDIKLDATAPSHLSLADFPANLGSECIDRPFPLNTKKHVSPHHFTRLLEPSVLVRVKGEYRKMNYPLKCRDFK